MISDVKHDGPPRPLLTIGEFASLTRLTTKALRIYDETGLLRPAHVDRVSGYRYYSADQAHIARLVGLLRASDVGLTEIGRMLAELDTDAIQAAERLDAPMFPIDARHVAAQRVMSMHRRLHADETDDFVAERQIVRGPAPGAVKGLTGLTRQTDLASARVASVVP